MSDAAYVVVPADAVPDHQVLGRISLFNEDGTPWTPDNGGGEPAAVAWGDVTGKPETFPPATHTHAWDDVTGKPSTFAPATHTHTIADIEGLQEALDAKADAA